MVRVSFIFKFLQNILEYQLHSMNSEEQLRLIQEKANADMFAQLSQERSDASDGSYLHHQAAKQPLSQPSSQSVTTKNQPACYTRNKRQRITHTVILSTSHQWTALHNTPCQAQTRRVTKNGDNSLLETHAQRGRVSWFTRMHLYESAISESNGAVGMN